MKQLLNRIFNKHSLQLIAACALVALLSVFAKTHAAESRPLPFSIHQWDTERAKVLYYLMKEEKINIYDDLKSNRFQLPYISISLADLDADGKPEIFAFIRHRSYCSSTGCMLFILQQTASGDLVPLIDPVNTERVFLTQPVVQGFRDVILSQTTAENGIVWRWSGKLYEFAHRYAWNGADRSSPIKPELN